jgi:hypothetical protein
MLAKEPAERHQSPAELLRDLRALPIATEDQEWLRQLDEWSVSETTALRDDRTQLVARLDTLMKTSAIRIPRRHVGRWVAAAAAALVLGAAAGWSMRPPSLLDQPAAPSKIERQPNAKEQFDLAFSLALASYFDDPRKAEAAWRAVIDYFPENAENKVWIHRAEQQLALLYLRQERNDEARRVFEKFAAFDEAEETFRAFGVAGLCLLATAAGDVAEVGKRLGELYPLRTRIDPDIRRRLEQSVPSMLRNAGATDQLRLWDEFFPRDPSGRQGGNGLGPPP